MKSRVWMLLLAGLFWRPQYSAAQDFIYRLSVDGLACGAELAGDPGTVARLQVTLTLETQVAGVMNWFFSLGGEGSGISFGVDRCAEPCLGARIGKVVWMTASEVVDPALVPRTGPLKGSPQGVGVIGFGALHPPLLDEGTFEMFKFYVEVIFPAEGKREEVLLLCKDGLSSPSVSRPVDNEVQVDAYLKPPAKVGCSFFLRGGGGNFLRGDCNGDGDTNGVTDAVVMLTNAFLGAVEIPCLAACDVDGDGAASGLTDAVTLLTHNFLGRIELPPPYPRCGPGSLESDARLGCRRPLDGCR